MKLRNKKTGEIGHFTSTNWNEIALIIMDDNGVQLAKYSSLADLNEEWEDYEEPKELKEPKKYWFINSGGGTASYYEEDEEPEDTEACKEIGNYFEAREEAEKAVEKLKAWKRLEDKGFRFDVVPALGHCDDEKFDISIIATMPAKWWYNDKVVDDIHYVFGGEE